MHKHEKKSARLLEFAHALNVKMNEIMSKTEIYTKKGRKKKKPTATRRVLKNNIHSHISNQGEIWNVSRILFIA